MSDPVRSPRRVRRVVAAALGGAILASAVAIAPAAQVAAYGGDPAVTFTVQPLGANIGGPTPTGLPNVPWSIQPQVVIIGDVDPSYTYTASLSIAPGSPSGNLSCSGGNTIQMPGGVAQWSGCSIDTPGQGYQLVATVWGSTILGVPLPPMSATSLGFNIGGSTPSYQSLQFTTQPLGANLGSARPSAQAGRAWSIQPAVAIVDQYGRPVSGDNTTVVQLAITSGTPQTGGPGRLTCSGGTATTVQDGVAQFYGCSIDTPGTAYQLTASTVSWGSTQILYDQSLPFDITGGSFATSVRFTTQPLGAVSGGTTPSAPSGTPWQIQPTVAVINSSGKVVSNDYSSVVNLSIDPSSTAGGQLYCASGTAVQVSAGYAYFAGCQIVGSGLGYRLSATAQTVYGTVGPTTSLPFNITAAASALDLQPSAFSIKPGTPMTFTATLSGQGAGGQTITFQGTNALHPEMTTFGTAVTNASGVATLTTPPVNFSATVQAVFAGNGSLAPATSSPDTIGVVAQLTISPSGTNSAKKGSSVTYTATLKPDPGQGQRVQFLIYQYVDGAWVYNNQRTYFTDGNSQVKLTWKWATSGKWYVRAFAPTNAYYTQGYSPTSIVNVK